MENDDTLRASTKKFLNLLKSAQTDSERFAALLVIGEMDKTHKLCPKERKLIYQSVDLTFIKRLLNTRKDPEDCKQGTLLSIGLTILLCMINEMDNLAENEEILKYTPRLLEVINEISHELKEKRTEEELFKKEILENSFKILTLIASCEMGCEFVINSGLDMMTRKKPNIENESTLKLIELLLQCMRRLTKEKLTSCNEKTGELMTNVAMQFSFSQDSSKFVFLELYLNVLLVRYEKNLIQKDQSRDHDFELKYLRKGLMDIIQSKVNVKYRHLAMKLASKLIEIYGLAWTYTKYQDEDQKYSQQFLHLLISLTSIEINMFFYDKKQDHELLSYLFSMVENTIEAISSSESQKTHLDTDIQHLSSHITAKLLQPIGSVVSVLVHFIDETTNTSNAEDACADIIIIACSRLLCVYMTEETQAMKKDIIRIAPYMLKLGIASFIKNKTAIFESIQAKEFKESRNQFLQPTIFSFLLPVLCHWTAEDKTRAIFLEEKMHKTLWEYLAVLLSCQHTRPEVHQAMETLFGIFMNLAITEPEMASDNGNIFGEMLQMIMQKLEAFTSKPANLVMNILTLGLIIARAQKISKHGTKCIAIKFFKSCLKNFGTLCPFMNSAQGTPIVDWAEISELWLIGLDNLSACVVESKEIQHVLQSDPMFDKFVEFFEQNKENKVDNIRVICSAIISFIKSVSRNK